MFTRIHILVLAVVLALGASSVVTPADAQNTEDAAPRYWVVVHPSNRARSIKKQDLARLFLKKTTRWPDDRVARPVDRQASAKIRERFTSEVIGRSVVAVRSYWQQAIFSGRDLPPPELTSDEAVVRYVLKNRGAVGYVTPGTALGDAKIIEVR